MIRDNNMKGFVLPAVLVASLLILLLILSAYSAVTMDVKIYSLYHEKKQLREDLKSAMLLYCMDSVVCAAGDSAEIVLFDNQEPVKILSRRHGLYEIVEVSNRYPDKYAVMTGRRCESYDTAALWLCDRNRALSLAADARVEGILHMPLNGINYTQIESRYYSGDKIDESKFRISSKELPAVDSSILAYAGELCRRNDGFVELVAPVRDTVISARAVRVRSGFKGSVQIFASDSVLIEHDAVMEYPSGVYVDSGEKRPYVCLERGAEVNGYVIVVSKESDSNLRYPSYIHRKGARLTGLLYVDGTCNIEGKIKGAAYIKDCYSYIKGKIYACTMYDSEIVRCDTFAFPVFMKGPYERKIIKKIH